MATVSNIRAADLGRVIRTLREERGMTQDEFAEQIGVTRAYLIALEQGDTAKTKAFTRLFRALGTLGVDVNLEIPARE